MNLNLDKKVEEELSEKHSSAYSNIDCMEIEPFLAVVNTVKLSYEENPEVYRMLLQVLQEFKPHLGSTHVEKTKKYIQILLKRKFPELADYLIDILPTSKDTLTKKSRLEENASITSEKGHSLHQRRTFLSPDNRKNETEMNSQSSKQNSKNELKFYNYVSPEVNSFLKPKRITQKITDLKSLKTPFQSYDSTDPTNKPSMHLVYNHAEKPTKPLYSRMLGSKSVENLTLPNRATKPYTSALGSSEKMEISKQLATDDNKGVSHSSMAENEGKAGSNIQFEEILENKLNINDMNKKLLEEKILKQKIDILEKERDILSLNLKHGVYPDCAFLNRFERLEFLTGPLNFTSGSDSDDEFLHQQTCKESSQKCSPIKMCNTTPPLYHSTKISKLEGYIEPKQRKSLCRSDNTVGNNELQINNSCDQNSPDDALQTTLESNDIDSTSTEFQAEVRIAKAETDKQLDCLSFAPEPDVDNDLVESNTSLDCLQRIVDNALLTKFCCNNDAMTNEQSPNLKQENIIKDDFCISQLNETSMVNTPPTYMSLQPSFAAETFSNTTPIPNEGKICTPSEPTNVSPLSLVQDSPLDNSSSQLNPNDRSETVEVDGNLMHSEKLNTNSNNNGTGAIKGTDERLQVEEDSCHTQHLAKSAESCGVGSQNEGVDWKSCAPSEQLSIYEDHPLEMIKRQANETSFEKPKYLGNLLNPQKAPGSKDPWGIRHLQVKSERVTRGTTKKERCQISGKN